jgi:tripartite-type tricarboxylate transporter receptor subunit TctC
MSRIQLLVRLSRAGGIIAAMLSSVSGACGQSLEPRTLFPHKEIRMIVGHPVGGDYDQGGRLLARYLAKYIPGQPVVIVQNMPAAASIVAANYLYRQAPRDGSVFGSFSRNIPNQAIMGQANLEANPRKFVWIGSTSVPSRVCVASGTSNFARMDDVFRTEMLMAGAGAGSSLSIIPSVLNQVIGTKFKVIEGYKGAPEAMLAIERGEVDGVCNTWAQFRSHQHLFISGKLRILFRAEEGAVPALKHVQSIFEKADTEEQRQLMRFIFSSVEFGRPYVLPPGTGAEIAEIYRAAFIATVQDPDLISDAKKGDLDMSYRTAKELEDLVIALFETPPTLVQRSKQLVPDQR